MITGTVRSFNSVRRLGLIKGDDGRDYSVHASGVESGVAIHEGDRVRFEAMEGGRGLRANRVERV